MFFEDTTAFASICSALSDGDPVDDIEALLSGELETPALYWALAEVGMAYGDDEPEFSQWVAAFIMRTLDSESGEMDVDNIPIYRSEYVKRKLRDLRSELVSIGAPAALISEILPE
jgi:hypothetical protein